MFLSTLHFPCLSVIFLKPSTYSKDSQSFEFPASENEVSASHNEDVEDSAQHSEQPELTKVQLRRVFISRVIFLSFCSNLY